MSPSTPPPPQPRSHPSPTSRGEPFGCCRGGGVWRRTGGTRGCPPRVTASFGLAGGGGGGGRARRLPAGATQEGSGGGPPHPATPEPSGCVWGGIHAWGGPFPAFRRLRLSLAPHRRPLHGERRGGARWFLRNRAFPGPVPGCAAPRSHPRPWGFGDGRRETLTVQPGKGLGGGGPPRREGQREGRCPRRCLSTFPARRSVSNGAAASGIAPGPPARLGSWAPQWGTWQCCVGPPALLGPQQWGTGGGAAMGVSMCTLPSQCCAPWGWSLLHLGGPTRAEEWSDTGGTLCPQPPDSGSRLCTPMGSAQRCPSSGSRPAVPGHPFSSVPIPHPTPSLCGSR